MKISVDLTLSPLMDDYDAPIRAFIKRLREGGFTIMENPLSTQIYGDYDKLMPFLQKEIRESFMNQDKTLLYMKIVKSDRSDYEPYS